jgi:[NiFe] hydrogenase diaphorase moiety large subunit
MAAQVGGPSGQLIGQADFDRKLCFDDLATGGSLMVFNHERDILHIVGKFMEFFIEESCGFCTPCRVGNRLLKERLERIAEGRGEEADLEYLESLGKSVKTASRCGLGQTSPNPVLSSLKNFREAYKARLRRASEGRQPGFDIHRELTQAVALTGRESVHFKR